MSDKPWTKRDDETQRAYEGFCVYRDLGPERSLQEAHDEFYGEGAGNLRYMEGWSSTYDWVDRASAYDQYLEEKRRQEYEKEMTSGLSHAGARVRKLKELHDRLESELEENLWLEDVKIGPQGSQVTIQKYNGQLVRDYLRALKHIAKEVGGRKKQVDVTSQGQSIGDDVTVRIEGETPLVNEGGA
jgi:hypothetical protein